MQQVIVGGHSDALFGAATEYNNLMGGKSWTSTEANSYQTMPTGGTISSLYVRLSGNVAADATAIFTLMVGGVAKTLTCTVAAGTSTASDLVNSVAVVAGNTVSLRCTYTGTPGTLAATWTVFFTGTTAGESICLALTQSSQTATTYWEIQGTGFETSAEVNIQAPMPTAGTFKSLYVQLSADPGTVDVDAYTIGLNVDGVASALTTTIIANNTTGNDTTHTVHVTAGQLVSMASVPISSPSVEPYTAIGMVFVPDTDGESLIMGGGPDPTVGSGTTEYNLLGTAYTTVWGTTEATYYTPIQACTIKNLYVTLKIAPGGTQTYTTSIQINSGNPSGLTVTITGTATTGNDVTHTATPTAGQLCDIKLVPSATAAATRCHIGLVGYICTLIPIRSFYPNILAH